MINKEELKQIYNNGTSYQTTARQKVNTFIDQLKSEDFEKFLVKHFKEAAINQVDSIFIDIRMGRGNQDREEGLICMVGCTSSEIFSRTAPIQPYQHNLFLKRELISTNINALSMIDDTLITIFKNNNLKYTVVNTSSVFICNLTMINSDASGALKRYKVTFID